MFIYFIWEQTYHNKALNFSPKKKKNPLNSFLITFLYILFKSKHIITNHNTFLKKWNKTQQDKINYTSITLKIGLFYGYVNKILSLYTRIFHLISLKNHSDQHLFVVTLCTYFLSALRSKTCGFCSQEWEP